jgi:hypothetical protein
MKISVIVPFVDEARALPQTLRCLECAMVSHRDVEIIAVDGGFRHCFSGDDWRLAAISALTNLRCRITSTFYGDQAMFVDRRAFVAVSGFPDRLAEDIGICEALRLRGAPAFLPQTLVTSSRKFERMGIWTSVGRVLAILLCLRIGRKPPPAFFADIR